MKRSALGRGAATLLLAAAAGLGASRHAAAHDPCPAWTPDLFGDPGPGGPVYAFAVFDAGAGPSLYAAGSFVSAGARTVNRIARWTGEEWEPVAVGLTTIDSGGFAVVRTLHVFDDGTRRALFVGGSFGLDGSGPPENACLF